jgi:rhodanese-related sulfurtransferase
MLERLAGYEMKQSSWLIRRLAAVLVLLGTAAATARAESPRHPTVVREADLPAHKRTTAGRYVTAEEAYRLATAGRGTLLIDVRTPEETIFAGVATPTHRHIPYMLLDETLEYDATARRYRLVVNPEFLKAMNAFIAEKGVGRDADIILLCSVGERSLKAANYLTASGYGAVTLMIGGVDGDGDLPQLIGSGWRRSGLPWTFELRPEQAYRNPLF